MYYTGTQKQCWTYDAEVSKMEGYVKEDNWATTVKHPDKELYAIFKHPKYDSEVLSEVVKLDGDWLVLEGTVSIDENVYEMSEVIPTIEFISKKSVNLNTEVDVTFYYDLDKKTYTIRLQDWSLWRTLTDEECYDTLIKTLQTKQAV